MNQLVLFKNAVANVLRGGAAALVAILLPPFLTRIMPDTTYGTWVLILQLSAYVGYLDFGIQTAVGRFVAHANELGDTNQRDRIVSTSLAILTGAAGLGIFLSGLLAWQLPNLFHEMPSALHTDARLALLFVGSSLAVGLPFSVFSGIFIGLQRYEIPAIIIGSGKLLGALLIVTAARIGGGLALMGAVLAIVNIGSYVVQFLVSRRLAKEVRITRNLISKQAGHEIFSYCFSLTIWSFGMLLVSGLDITIVGLFEYSAVAYYGIAVTLVTFIASLQNAVFSVLMPQAAVLGAHKDAKKLGRLLSTSTRYGMFMLLLTGLPLIFIAKPILTIWVGGTYAQQVTPVLQILLVANIVRWSAAPYATLLIGTGQQKLVIISPLVEGLTNLIFSLIAGAIFGAVGVAWGTLAGGIVGIASNIFYNMLYTTDISIRRREYVQDGLVRPILCSLPLLLSFILLIDGQGNFRNFAIVIMGLISVVFSIGCIIRFGLVETERRYLALSFQRLCFTQ